jgi:FtsH-binding integral membrane protein
VTTYELRRSRPVAELRGEARSAFIQRTYLHLFAAIAAFTAIECYLFGTGLALPIAGALLGTSWLVVLGGFVLVGWIASRTAHAAASPGAQYAALVGYVVAESVLFVPLLLLAQLAAPGAIESAAFVTLLAFTGLTVVVWKTGRDFSFLGSLLGFAGVVALVLIAAGTLFGFELGTFLSVAMVGLAGAAILHDTSNVLHRYSKDRHVGAALELFASVALMFWYVLRLFLSRQE